MVKQESAHQQPSNERVWSACRLPDTYQYVYSIWYTPHTDTAPDLLKKMYLSFIQPLCYTFLFPLFVSESEETSLSVSAFSLSCACTHTHTPTHQYSTCTDTQPPAPTETKTHTYTTTHTRIDCLLLLWWLRAVKTPLLSLPLSPKQLDWACLCRFRDCCLSTLILSFLTFSSAVCILILLSRAFQPLPTYILNNALLYVPVYCIRLSFKCLGGTLSVHKGLYWLVKVFAHNTFPHYVKQSQNWIHCFVFLPPPPFLAYMDTNFYPPVCIHACEDFLHIITHNTVWNPVSFGFYLEGLLHVSCAFSCCSVRCRHQN